MRKFNPRFLIPFLVLLICGCGNPLGRRAIDGRVTLDGAPLKSGNINFIPKQSGGVGSGTIISQGEYHLEDDKGLPPGTYLVQVFSPSESTSSPAPMGAPGRLPPPAVERIPPQYNVNSTLEVVVTESGSINFDFDLKTTR